MSHLISDPFLDSARELKRARDRGEITPEQYQRMFDAVAAAAEQDAQICEAKGCDRPAYVVQRGRKLCAVCALKERAKARFGRG